MSRAYTGGADPDSILGERMSGIAAVMRALVLHRAGLSYQSISTVMRVYHGSKRSPESWRSALRSAGAEPRAHAGRVFKDRREA